MNNQPLSIGVITGFLGCGKTTLLGRLLTQPGMDRTLVVVNDFGEIGLDHLLIANTADEIISLEGGCLCCSLQGDLVATLKSIVTRRTVAPEFDRVLIETTGLADPIGILHTLLTDPELAPHFSVDGVITVVDSLNGAETLRSQAANVRQVRAADHLVISKTDISPPDEVTVLMQDLRRINPAAEQHVCIKGQIDPSLLFVGAEQKKATALKAVDRLQDTTAGLHPSPAGHNRGMPMLSDHSAHHGIRTFTLTLRDPVTQECLALWMHLISAHLGSKLLRIKGIVNVAGAPIVIHAVRYLFYEPLELPEWPDQNRDTRIVFITEGIERQTVESTFSAFGLPPVRRAGLDPARYGQIARVLQDFRRAGELGE